jgi:hypothetical protein
MLKNILPPTTKRVRFHTNEKVNEKIEENTQNNIEYYRTKSNEEIVSRIRELDREWDIERALETNASALIFLSTILGLRTRRKGYFIFTSIISGFLLEHALQGWCPPVPIFRRLGVRTSEEIEREKYNLRLFIK